jgi:hypothetical protein
MTTVMRVLVLAAVAGLAVVLARIRVDAELGDGDRDVHDRRWWLVVILAYAPVPLVLYAFGRVIWAL